MQQFKDILCVTHGLEHDHHAMKQAISLAHSFGAKLKVLIVTPEFPATLEAYQETYQQALRNDVLQSINAYQQELVRDQNLQPIAVETEATSPYDVHIIQRVLRDGHDLLIKAVEPIKRIAGFKALDMELIRKCPCPVWVFRAMPSSQTHIRIAVAIDPEREDIVSHELSVELLKTGAVLSHAFKGDLTVITCWDYPLENTLRNSPFINIPETHVQDIVHEKEMTNRKALDKIIQEAQLSSSIQIQYQRGVPDELIPKLITELNIDILVMGTVGRTGIPGFIIGNTAENVLQKVSCSLLALKPNGFVSPVKD